MTDQHNTINTGDLPSSNSHIPASGPSTTNYLSTSSIGDDIQPLILHSTQFDTFYPLPLLQAIPLPDPTMAILTPMQPVVTVPHVTHSVFLACAALLETMAMQPAIMPVVQFMPIAVPAAMQPAVPDPIVIDVASEVRKQIIEHVKRRIVRFLLTAHVMASTDNMGAALVSLAILEAVSIPVTIKTTSNQQQQIMVAWNNIFQKLLAIIQSCLTLGYNFYPPTGSNVTPD
ncbi:hypothetical protein F4604DRAFT_1686682 [Suillus subluteus]|nr:hypothetical protein F4604DRAFT_1686682 [Suillus subluteus]